MQVVPDAGLSAGPDGPAVWKVLAIGIFLGLVIARFLEPERVRVVRFRVVGEDPGLGGH